MQATEPHIRPAERVWDAPVNNARMPWWVPLTLSLPALFPLVWTSISAWNRGLIPTAFIQYDLAYYLANARQHFAQGFHLAYGNPYAPYDTPEVYFQPHLFLLGFLQWLGLSPDAALILFGLATLVFTSTIAGRLYQEWVGWDTTAKKIGFACFFWGGGVMALFGAALGLMGGANLASAALSFDPADGWWMLNFGRNLVNPSEAYYHGLFLLTMLLVSRRHLAGTLATAALLSISHPFTGISLALILVAYSALERWWKLLAGSAVIAALHVGYYVFFLQRFEDHRVLALEWGKDWPYLLWTMVPALYLVGVLAFGPLTRWKNLAAVLAQPRMRLCLVWFAVIIALTQHDLVMAPQQPIHFAHGYDWMALFFLAAPGLLKLIEKTLAAVQQPLLRGLAVAGLVAVFVSDNVAWFATFTDPSVQRHAIALSPDEKDVLDWLGQNGRPAAYVASTDRWINYLPATYTHLRSWSGHDYNTPHGEQRRREVGAAFESGAILPTRNPVYYVPGNDQKWAPPEGLRQVYANPSFTVWLAEAGR